MSNDAVGVGIEPTSIPFQGIANPSQLSDLRMGFGLKPVFRGVLSSSRHDHHERP